VTGQRSYIIPAGGMDDPTTDGATEGFGLMFYNARWYDPQLGRFAQADTIVTGESNRSNATIKNVADNQYVALTTGYFEVEVVTKLNHDNAFLVSKGGIQNLTKEDREIGHIVDVPTDTQVFDRYCYGLNNPFTYTDPTGFDSYAGDSTFGYYQSGIMIKLWVNGESVFFNLKEIDLETLSLIQDFKRRVESYENAIIGKNTAALVAVAAAGAGIITCLPTAGGGCYAGAAVAVAGIAVMEVYREEEKSYKEKGKELFDDLVRGNRNGKFKLE
jgi:hypothetical protein